MLCRRPGLVADRGANMLEYVGITIAVCAVIVAIGMTTVPSDIQAGFANGVCRIVNPDDPDCKDGGATASPAPPGESGDPSSAPPTGDPTGDPTSDPGTGTDSDVGKAQEEADAANKELEDAEEEWGNLDEELLGLVADLVGWTSAKDCFTKGDIGACLETLLTAIPWGKLFKAAKMIPKIWKLFKRWQKLRKRLGDAKNAKKKADKKLDDAKKKTCPIPNSFVPGTRVVMAGGGTKPIEDVRVGERVLAADTRTGVRSAQPVTALIIGDGTKRLVDVTIDADGEPGGATATLTATDGHPFYNPATRRWVPAGDLTPGSVLRTDGGGQGTVTALRERTESRRVHNLTVANLHNYHVRAGAAAVLVHNDEKKECPPGPGDKPKKVVNSNMGHIDEARAERAGFSTQREATDAVRELGDTIGDKGFPKGTIPDTARADRVLVPIGTKGYAVYQIKPNGNAVFKTILEKR